MAVVGMRRFWLGKAMPAVLAAALCVWCVPASALADVGEGAALADAVLANPVDNALEDGELPADTSAAFAGDAVIESTEGLGGEFDSDAVAKGGSDLAVAVAAPSAPGDAPAGEASLSVSLSADERAASVVASGGLFSLAESVSFPAWSEAGGQDDLAWYAASRRADGSWAAEVPVSAHRSAGAYAVHAYATVAGAQAFAGEASFEVSAPRAEVSVGAVDDASGTFEVVVSGVSSPSGVASVQVPAWSDAGGQDDVVWHAASRQADGTYRAVVSAADHGCGDGAYTAHVYVTGENGVMACVGGASASLELRDYVAVTGAQGSGSRTVWVKNPAGGASSVQVPTWSEAGGQDDIVWYQAAYQGDGLWKCVVDCRNFRSAGTCVSHVYADGRGVGGVSYSVTDAEILPSMYRSMNERVSGLASSTNYLIAIDNSNCFIGIYRGGSGNWTNVCYWSCAPGKWSTPTVRGIYRVGSRGYVFGSGYSCYYWTQFYGNYLFHSVLYYPGTRVVMDGTMGVPASHGCVRLDIDHAKWIYDNIPTGTAVLSY